MFYLLSNPELSLRFYISFQLSIPRNIITIYFALQLNKILKYHLVLYPENFPSIRKPFFITDAKFSGILRSL